MRNIRDRKLMLFRIILPESPHTQIAICVFNEGYTLAYIGFWDTMSLSISFAQSSCHWLSTFAKYGRLSRITEASSYEPPLRTNCLYRMDNKVRFCSSNSKMGFRDYYCLTFTQIKLDVLGPHWSTQRLASLFDW